MMSLHFITSHAKPAAADEETIDSLVAEASLGVFRALGLASLVLGATAIGLYLGRELRQRYKFKRRTPYDFYSKAGDPVAITEYGMGV